MIPIIETNREPQNTNVLWLDPRDNTIKRFESGGWKVISGLQSADVSELKETLRELNNTLTENKSSDIDTFEEVKESLKGFKDTENIKEYIDQQVIDASGNEAISKDELNDILS